MIIQDAPTLTRDENSKAIVSTNRGLLQELKSKREMNQKILSLQSRIEILEEALNSINKALMEKHG